MNKEIQSLVEEFNLEKHGNVFAGVFFNYQGFLDIDVYAIPAYKGGIFAHIGDKKERVVEFLTSKKKEFKLINFEVFDNAFLFATSGVTYKSLKNNYHKIFEEVSQFFTQIGVLDCNYCPICGELMETKTLSYINNVPVYVDEKCAAEKNAIIEKRDEEFKKAPNNYLQGTLGAILGGLVGAIVWVAVAYFTGFISGFISLLIAVLASVGYDLLKGKPTKVKLPVIFSITIVLSVVSMLVCYIILASTNNMTLADLLMDKEIKVSFITDMIFAAAFGAVGAFLSYSFVKKKIRN